MKMKNHHPTMAVCALACAVLLAGCKTAPPQPSSDSEGPPARPVAAPPAPAPAPAPVAIQRSEAEIRQLLDAARNLLDQGQDDAAETELAKVLESDPGQKTAQALLRSIRDDPNALYGREFFAYRVAVGDTLAIISQRLMGDRDQFFGLARYNGIKVPRQLQVGQQIKVPGKAPRVTTPAPAPSPAAAAPVAAPAPAPVAPPPAAPPPPNPQAEGRERQAKVDAYSRQARVAMARQDVCGAIGAWDKVLEIDPGNRSAELERAKAVELKKKLPASKC